MPTDAARDPALNISNPPDSFLKSPVPPLSASHQNEHVPAVSITVPKYFTDTVLIQLTGEVDVYEGHTIRATAATAVAARRAVTINCQDLTFMDSSVLILFAALARAKLPVIVIGLIPRLRRMLELTGLDQFIDFLDS